MQEVLASCELFEDLDPTLLSPLMEIAGRRSLARQEYLFLLGDRAESIYVLLEGKVEVCFPLSVGGSVKDLAVEQLEAGRAFGLSALVKPYRFTFSARAAEKTELATFARSELLQLLDREPRVGCALMGRITEILGRRFLNMRALWAREVQRSINTGATTSSPSPEG